jgi:hypothetical protein
MNEFKGVAARRIAPRYPADFPARLTDAAGTYIVGRLIDLSMQGAAFRAARAWQGEPAFRLEVANPEEGWRLSIPGRIVTVEPDPLGGFIHRMRFRLDHETAKALARVVTDLRRRFNARQAAIATERLGPYGDYSTPGEPAA